MTVTSLPFSSSTCEVERVGVLATELEDVAHLDAARGLERAVVTVGQGSPSRTSATSMTPSAVKSRPATRSSTWLPLDVGAGDPARCPRRCAGRRGSGCRTRLLPQRAGPDVALDQRRVRRRTRPRPSASTSVGSEDGLEPLLVDVAVTGHADGERLAGAVGVLEHRPRRSSGCRRRPGTVVARVRLVEVVDQRLDRRGVRRVLGVRGRRHRRTGTAGGRPRPATASTLAA